MWWKRTAVTLLSVSFGTYRRRRRNVVMERRGYLPLRRRGDVQMRGHCYVLLRCRHDVPIRRRGDVPLRRPGGVPPRCRWVFHSRRTCDVAGTYRETSLRRCHDILLASGDIFSAEANN